MPEPPPLLDEHWQTGGQRRETCEKSVGFAVISTPISWETPWKHILSTLTVPVSEGRLHRFTSLVNSCADRWQADLQNWSAACGLLDKGNQKRNQCRQHLGFTDSISNSDRTLRWKIQSLDGGIPGVCRIEDPWVLLHRLGFPLSPSPQTSKGESCIELNRNCSNSLQKNGLIDLCVRP